MDKTITRHSDTEIVLTETTETVVSIENIGEQLRTAEASLAEFEDWVVRERSGRQEIIDGLVATISQAKAVGVEAIAEAVPLLP